MPSIINATTTAGVSVQGDNSGTLALQTNNGTNAITIDTAQNVTFAKGPVISGNTLGAGDSSAMKNRIINGAMVIDQRNAGAAVTNANGYTLDRWRLSEDSTGGVTVQQDSTAPTGFVNSLKVTVTTADAVSALEYVMLRHKIEGFNVADLMWGTANAKTVTLSFWVRSSLTGTFGGVFANSTQARIYPYTYTISAANTWEYKTITVAGDTTGTWLTNNGTGIEITWGLGVGTDYSGTAGSWSGTFALSATGAVSVVGTLGATWQVTGVQLEVGTQATSFEYRQYQQELALCQRYYYLHASASSKLIGSGQYSNSTRVDCSLFFKASMRATPSLVQTTGTNFYTVYANNATDTFDGFTAIDLASTEGCALYVSSNVSGTSGHAGVVYTNNASASIAFSAEL